MSDLEELATDEIIAQVKAAFAPNHCDVIVEFRASLWCEVFDKNQRGHSQNIHD